MLPPRMNHCESSMHEPYMQQSCAAIGVFFQMSVEPLSMRSDGTGRWRRTWESGQRPTYGSKGVTRKPWTFFT